MKRDNDIPNPAYGGCICPCHNPGSEVIHLVPCCYPADDECVTTSADTHYNLTLELGRNTFASRLLLTAMTNAIDGNTVSKLADLNSENDGLDIMLTANGYLLNFEAFAQKLEENIDRAVDERAKELAHEVVSGRFDDISELALDLETRLKEEVNKRLEDWEEPV